MFYYFIVVLSVIGTAAVFSLNKIYQLKAGDGVINGVKKNIPMTIIICLMFFFMNGMKLHINLFTFIMAFLMAVFSVFSVIVYYKGYANGSISVFTMFQMQGGMMLPFIYGVFYGNKLSAFAIIGIFLMIISLIIPFYKEKIRFSKSFTILCVFIFIINGGISIVSYIYSNNKQALNLYDYLILYNILNACISIVTYFVLKSKNKFATVLKHDKNTLSLLWILIISVSVVSGFSYYLQLLGASHLPAVALYPMITGGAVIFTTIAGRILFKEKLSLKSYKGIIITAIATLFFIF